MPIIQIDVQPLNEPKRAELRARVVVAVSAAIGSPDQYINVIIRESHPTNFVEAGGWGPYGKRQPIRNA